MKAPKCPKCGKEHYSTQRCGAEKIAERFIEERGFAEAIEAVKPTGKEKARMEKFAAEFIEEVIKEALTPAEKQKAYRERHPDRVHEADRLRKRIQSDGDN